jgi:predicted Zn-dependent protease
MKPSADCAKRSQKKTGSPFRAADWFFHTRHLLGAVLISAGKPADAEAVYRDDLSRHPNNGWALYGLTQSLKLQGRSLEASKAQQQFEAAWKNADVTLVASAY